MGAYSFDARFAPKILTGTKLQTIRGDRKRHARPCEEMQLYIGMRTRRCHLIGRSICKTCRPVRLDFARETFAIDLGPERRLACELNRFARLDGFESWDDMRAFWRVQHPETSVFYGVIIGWGRLLPGAAA